MSGGLNSDENGASEHQVCDIFATADFVVTSGVNAGDGVSGAEQSFVGDTYVFSSHASAFDLVIPDGDDGDDSHASDDHNDDEHEQAGNQGSDSHALGKGTDLDSRLTFIGSDGSNIEVLILNESSEHDGDDEGGDDDDDGSELFFLPLSPLVPDMEYTLIKADEDPGEFHFSDYTCVCFARGTAIRMADGSEKPIELLAEGDLVKTRDNGCQPVRWVGGRMAAAFGHLAPIVICKDALGNHADLIVSPQHRILLSDWRAEVMLGSHEVLVKAKDLINGDMIYRRQGGVVEYFHILFDTHEIIYAEGIPSESLHINKTTLDSMADESRAEIIELFPEIDRCPQVSAVASRMSLKSYEASALLKQVGFR